MSALRRRAPEKTPEGASMPKHKKHERKKELDRRRKRKKTRIKEKIRQAKSGKA